MDVSFYLFIFWVYHFNVNTLNSYQILKFGHNSVELVCLQLGPYFKTEKKHVRI